MIGVWVWCGLHDTITYNNEESLTLKLQLQIFQASVLVCYIFTLENKLLLFLF